MAPRQPAVETGQAPIVQTNPAHFTPPVEPTPDTLKRSVQKKTPKIQVVLRDTAGGEVSEKDYFYSTTGTDAAPEYFNKAFGMPVDREDMLDVFHDVFAPNLGFLFYKSRTSEVYAVIVPLKFSKNIGAKHDSRDGDAQIHAISFIGDGSVNLDTLETKLKRILNFVDFNKR